MNRRKPVPLLIRWAFQHFLSIQANALMFYCLFLLLVFIGYCPHILLLISIACFYCLSPLNDSFHLYLGLLLHLDFCIFQLNSEEFRLSGFFFRILGLSLSPQSGLLRLLSLKRKDSTSYRISVFQKLALSGFQMPNSSICELKRFFHVLQFWAAKKQVSLKISTPCSGWGAEKAPIEGRRVIAVVVAEIRRPTHWI